MHDKNSQNSNGSNFEYYAVSTERILVFSILTFGIYKFYWFYKNWSAFKKSKNLQIMPFMRSLFSVLYCHSLFKKVLRSAKNHGYKKSYSAGWLTLAYILLVMVGNATDESRSPESNFMLIATSIFAFLPLLPVQNAINFYYSQIPNKPSIKRGFSDNEAAGIIVYVLLFLLALYGYHIKISPLIA